jgi:CheY-like chemotaxis protein
LSRQPQIAGDQVLNEGLRSLEHNAKNISRLVDDCLDIARISQGKIKLQFELLDLFQVVGNSLDAVWEQARSKGIEFSHELSRNLFVWGDRTRLEEVMLNLFTNAIKYTDNGGRIFVRLGSSGNQCELEVSDNGIGIEPEFLEQIFQPFRQGTTTWFTSQSGLGIGLSIVMNILQMHGGHVWAESPGRGQGSTFRVRLPLAEASTYQQSTPQDQHPVPCKVKALRILFIEDSKDVLNLMKMVLEELGYSVLIAADGISGLEIARRELPEAIISDIKMPGMDGYELIRQLRRIPQLAKVPAIAMSGFGMDKDVENALAAGYDAHVRKPVEIDELSVLIQQLTSAGGGSNEVK